MDRGAWWTTFHRDTKSQTQLNIHAFKVKLKVTQSCLTLCNPVAYTIYGILQARILEWVAFPFSRESSQPRDFTQVSRIAGRFFTSRATREALMPSNILQIQTRTEGQTRIVQERVEYTRILAAVKWR